MSFVLPSRSQVGYLDPEIAGEGQKIVLDNGDQVSWTPPPEKPVMPDWSQIKSIRHYFGRTGHQVYPAWLYHPTEESKLVKNAEEARALGVMYRKTTDDESGRYGLKAVWDWDEGCKWRPQPYRTKFDPAQPGIGKTVIHGTPNPVAAQSALIEALIPTVTAAVVTALKSSGNAAAPAAIDPAQWEAFLQFQAWQKTSEAVGKVVDEVASDDPEDGAEVPAGNALNALTPEQDRALWVQEAEAQGITVDKRWGIERLKAEVEKKKAA